MTHAELRELLPAYALDALEAGEVSLVETHLSACAECRRDLREFQEVAAHLAHA
ncbi:MAG: zf-HC2 domain-containing protein, partial [Chloroflexi bacterium]|nr:zf-HC2 domain-containing protein [Chloroflexota bacterium]